MLYILNALRILLVLKLTIKDLYSFTFYIFIMQSIFLHSVYCSVFVILIASHSIVNNFYY